MDTTGEKFFFAGSQRERVMIGGKEREIVLGPWENGPDPDYPDDCRFRQFQFKGINPEYTDGVEIEINVMTPPQFLASKTTDWEAYQQGNLKLLVVINNKLLTYQFNSESKRGTVVNIPKGAIISWVAQNKEPSNIALEGTGPGFYNKQIPGKFDIVPKGSATFNGCDIPSKFWEEISKAESRRAV